jgi:hypothetical protein
MRIVLDESYALQSIVVQPMNVETVSSIPWVNCAAVYFTTVQSQQFCINIFVMLNDVVGYVFIHQILPKSRKHFMYWVEVLDIIATRLVESYNYIHVVALE